MSDVFTPDEIESLTSELNQQLLALQAEAPATQRGAGAGERRGQRQLAAIAAATGQDAASFLVRFRQAARKDLCEEGGLLHEQWKKYRDLASKDMLNRFGGILVGFGLAGSALQVAVVAVAVYVLYLGVQAFCAGEE
jgi:hypothetical protein